MCATNYLGLANSPTLIAAARRGLDEFGLGVSSVRFICGTQTIHKILESKISSFLRMPDTILYSSAFEANGGVFEPLLGRNDVVISDAGNHASTVDGIRLCRARAYNFAHGDLSELEARLQKARARNARRILITTNGVFPMDGYVADLKSICDLADKYQALVMVDDAHATGFFGPTGRGSIEHCGVMDRVDIVTSTLGKAMGGAVGGFTSGRQEIIDLLRQRSRPYLFSNSLPPALVCAAIACVDLLSGDTSLRDKLEENSRFFREGMAAAGYALNGGLHPNVAIMLGDAKLANSMAARLFEEGVHVVAFSSPVVPQGAARIRVLVSAGHSREDLQFALDAFKRVGLEFGIGRK